MSYISSEQLLDRTSDYYVNQFTGAIIKNKKTLDGRNVFKVSHETMVQKWNAINDYELGIIERGICKTCCCFMTQMHELKPVVTQIGAARFGLSVGICLACINAQVERKQFNQLKFYVPFSSSDDVHEICITLNLLKNLVERERAIGDTETESPIKDVYKFVINKILEIGSQSLEKSLKEQSKSMLCKTCFKLKITNEDYFNELNDLRKIGSVVGYCLGCSKGIKLDSGCSMATCSFCLSSTKTCIICMEGATGDPHNLGTCTEKMYNALDNCSPLPELRKCECPN